MAETSLKALKLKRGNIKSSLTRLCTYLDFNEETIDLTQLRERQAKLEDLFVQFDEIQNQIELNEDCVIQEEERKQFENTYFQLISRIKIILANNDQVSSISSIQNNQTASGLLPHNRIKLPTLELPSFSGDYDHWFPFFDTFNSLIHLNKDISQVHKFQYLKSCLKGDAANVIHSLEISENNYNDAWKLLVNRYDNKRLIAHKHIQAIHELSPATKENHICLRSLLDGFLKHVRALAALKRPTEYWDDLLIYLLMSKVDYSTRKEWEAHSSSTEFPNFVELTDFLTRKCNTLEKTPKTYGNSSSSSTKMLQLKKTASYVITNNSKCTYCGEDHRIYRCSKFLENTAQERIQQVKSKGLCYNCLQTNHSATQCKSGVCKTCNRKHHTLLHLAKQSVRSPPPGFPDSSPSTSISNYSASFHTTMHVLLSTAIVKFYDVKGRSHLCRVLLDSGSQSNLITKDFAAKLALPQRPALTSITGISQSISPVTKSIQAKLKSMHGNFHAEIECLVLNSISSNLPQISFPRNAIPIPKNLKLADPEFHQSRSIDALIGANLFFKLLCIGRIDLGKNQPILQKTLLGWILSGQVTPLTISPSQYACNLSTTDCIDRKLAKFWELEELHHKSVFTPEETICEEHFKTTHTRNIEGRFVVELPLKPNAPLLGNSREQALKRFYALERRLSKQPELKMEYCKFMREYHDLGHMRRLSQVEADRDDISTFYLPHHAVVKENSSTTKVRVVFDGSAKSSSGHSLNDTLIVGPKLQQDLVEIVARFRTHQVVITADIAKMYRQVLVKPPQTALQRILWREDEMHNLETFELTTVTYGTASASYLAIKSLQQLAIDNQQEFTLGADILLRDFYVDDLLTGSSTVEGAEAIRKEIVSILARGGFELRKWTSNNRSLLQNISSQHVEHEIVELDKSEGISTLGLQWNPNHDLLQYSVKAPAMRKRVTKRTVLSTASQIFDPLGLVAPVIILAKIFIQQLWELGVNWDESLPLDLANKWLRYEEDLKDINLIKIPRNVLGFGNPKAIEFHGFCDASERAYGACIYVRVIRNDGLITCNLLCSKSRVAPLKAVSLPRLELCGALLLAQLSTKMKRSINLRLSKIYHWTDSTIVLSWLKSSSKTWKTFVANRVNEIQEMTNVSDWYHVGTNDNPADVLSRGSSSVALKESRFWWEGPNWLQEDISHWIRHTETTATKEEMLERRSAQLIVTAVEQEYDWFSKYSDFTRIVRITGFCQRFKSNLIARLSNDKAKIQIGPLTTENLRSATIVLMKMVQGQCFSEDLRDLQKRGSLNPKSRLLSLNPFIDEEGVLRVGGRLRHSTIPYTQRHQILLPSKHPFTEALVRAEHLKQLHAGPQTTLAVIRNKYWILTGLNSIKSVIRKCLTCFRARPSANQQTMGDLPASRIVPSRPFENVGIDYFGPLYLKEGRRKNSCTSKAYGVVFVCFATKAIHLELVGDLTSERFLSALKRFISRRGKPAHIHSDNGTQFTGAYRELTDLKRLFQAQNFQDEVMNFAAQDRINWHFIPARSPHFGGLWEAAVKAVKHHTTRVLGKTSLTYEEMETLLVQIEAILNSRPLTPISNNPNDFSFLTPGHFLIGDSMAAVPEPSVSHLKLNKLSRWQYIQQVREHFWRRWSKEYLNQLQPRNRWKASCGAQLEPGAMVLLREDNSPPMHWPIGRVQEVFPGQDGIVRVVTVKTAKGTYRRAASKLCVLPVEQ